MTLRLWLTLVTLISCRLQGMSGTLNHSPSMDFSDPRRPEGALGPHSVLQPAGVPHQQHSPLQHFVQVVVGNVFIRTDCFFGLQAKKKINEIFLEVEGYVGEAERFLASIPRF